MLLDGLGWPSWNQWLFELGQFFQTGGWVLYGILAVLYRARDAHY